MACLFSLTISYIIEYPTHCNYDKRSIQDIIDDDLDQSGSMSACFSIEEFRFWGGEGNVRFLMLAFQDWVIQVYLVQWNFCDFFSS
jgi:hypothetical protein